MYPSSPKSPSLLEKWTELVKFLEKWTERGRRSSDDRSKKLTARVAMIDGGGGGGQIARGAAKDWVWVGVWVG
ncbi:hypothetical protein RHMOL_Rhmol07G0270100 [Rhododendron molle]|uniref:Uncharacterized protein n=1 Tax=Rhododendron molle TaxID=49168 RepID=A0ACC0N5D7_RHOML|nr:hypothetical protein RHMOL_Rhmol07G0270100 [Rhododendron molle]